MVWLFSSVLMTTLEGHLRGEASIEWAHHQNVKKYPAIVLRFYLLGEILEILVAMFEKVLRILNPRIKYPRSSGF